MVTHGVEQQLFCNITEEGSNPQGADLLDAYGNAN